MLNIFNNSINMSLTTSLHAKSNGKTNQKLIYTKDLAMNSTGNMSTQSVPGIFKSSSSLARSLKQSGEKKVEDRFGGYVSGNSMVSTKNSFSSSAKLIMGSSAGSMAGVSSDAGSINKFSKMRQAVNPYNEIRNLTHFYDQVDSEQKSYELFAALKAEKRMNHLDAIDDYEVWKVNYIAAIEDRIKRKIEQLKENLEKTKSEINSKFSISDNELIPMVQTDINQIEGFFYQTISKRREEISQTKVQIVSLDAELIKTIENNIAALKRELIDIGFMLDFECEAVAQEKLKDKDDHFKKKEDSYEHLFTDIVNGEDLLIEQSKENLKNFLLRWKNVKLNNYIGELKLILSSSEFVDNSERYELINDLKNDQIKIYQMRVGLIINNMYKLPPTEISARNIEDVNKRLEEIYNNAQNIYDNHTQKLVENSDNILKKSLHEIEKFKKRVKTISYEFGEGKDNFNENKFNQYENLNSIEELIDFEISPLINQSKNDRKDYISKIIAYLDDYDEYTHSNCQKLVNMFSTIGTRNDEHKKQLHDSERNYLLDIAKAGDHDEDVIFQKEETLKNILQKMKESVHKSDLNEGLEGAFKVMDELEVEYREFFNIIENLFNSHEGRLIDIFLSYEAKVLAIFGILGKEKMEEILARRMAESEFLSKRKEAEIALEEMKALEEDKNNPGKKGSMAKKKAPQPNVKLKKGELPPPLIPPREILEFKSKLDFEYLIDFTILELVQHNLRNIIHNREDDIFGLNVEIKGNNLINIINVGNTNSAEKKATDSAAPSKKSAGKDTNRPQSKSKGTNTNPLPTQSTHPNQTGTNFLELFNPYGASRNKDFISPLSLNGDKLLSDENTFTETFLTEILEKLFEMLCERISEDLKYIIDVSKATDNEKREEYLSELDIRLKSLAPRKGKIEVEEYDKRLNEIEKHIEKFNQHVKIINERNSKDGESNTALLDEITQSYDELNQLFEKLYKGMEEEQTLKGLDDKHKKFKTTFYDLESKLAEVEIKLKQFSKTNPENLLQLNHNFILGLKTFSENGTFSDQEVTFYKEKIEMLNNETILKDMEERKNLNENKLSLIKTDMKGLMEKIEKRYTSSNENIMAKDSVGKKFGAPKRLANDVIINMKMKCNQAQDGLDGLLKSLKDSISKYEVYKKHDDYILQNHLPLEIRRFLLSINNCVFNYGKYIEAFKQSLMSSYSLFRVTMNEISEVIENSSKEDLEEDERRKKEELRKLGLLSNFILNTHEIPPSQNVKGDKNKDKDFPNFLSELNSIEDKVKAECVKVYTGEFAKLINNPTKLPPALVPFLQNVKTDLENFRLKCIRGLRTFCQHLYDVSLSVPATVIEFIYNFTSLSKKIKSEELMDQFNTSQEDSENCKKELNSKLGPYLANPYFLSALNEIEEKEKQRQQVFITEIDTKQLCIIENEEKFSNEFCKRIINNFEVLLTIFDNFIFEEEFISLGDEEYFKDKKDFNFLLKLKAENKAHLNLDSKRTFKKIYVGVDKNKFKINYYDRFQTFCLNYLQNNEDKVKVLNSESQKENLSKQITGIKLQNNKNLFLERNLYCEKYCEEFKNKVSEVIEYFDQIRVEEIKYEKRWEEILTELKSIK